MAISIIELLMQNEHYVGFMFSDKDQQTKITMLWYNIDCFHVLELKQYMRKRCMKRNL